MGDFDRVREACEWLRPRLRPAPEAAVVLGSGLGGFADALVDATVVPYGEIPHWPASRVVGHAGRLAAGAVAERRVIALAGRVHAYEGHDLHTVTFAVQSRDEQGGGLPPQCARRFGSARCFCSTRRLK